MINYELIAGVISKFPDKRIAKADLVIDLCKALVAEDEKFDVVEFALTCLGLEIEKGKRL